jgi:hypothetical protein
MYAVVKQGPVQSLTNVDIWTHENHHRHTLHLNTIPRKLTTKSRNTFPNTNEM